MDLVSCLSQTHGGEEGNNEVISTLQNIVCEQHNYIRNLKRTPNLHVCIKDCACNYHHDDDDDDDEIKTFETCDDLNMYYYVNNNNNNEKKMGFNIPIDNLIICSFFALCIVFGKRKV